MKDLLKAILYPLLTSVIILIIILSAQSCTDTDGKQVSEALTKKVTVRNGGQIITFPNDSPGLDEFKVSSAKKGSPLGR